MAAGSTRKSTATRANITLSELRQAAEAGGVDLKDVARNIDEAISAGVGVRGSGGDGRQEKR